MSVLFQTIQFTISTQLRSIWPIDRTLSSGTSPGQSGPGSYGNKGILRVTQSSSFTGTSPSDCLVWYIRTLVRGFLSTAEKQLGVFYSLKRLSNFSLNKNIINSTFENLKCHCMHKSNHYYRGGVRGVMVIVVGNGHGDMSSNPGRDWKHFT